MYTATASDPPTEVTPGNTHTNSILTKQARAALAGIRKSLARGTSPQRLALSIAMGLIIGIIPLVWGASLICFMVALLFRLDHAGIQAANLLVYPLQLALLLPFVHWGDMLFPQVHILAPGYVGRLGEATLKALAVWALAAPAAVPLLYLLLHPVMRRLAASRESTLPP